MKLNQNKFSLALLGILPTIPLQIIFSQISARATELGDRINNQQKTVYFVHKQNKLQESLPNFENQTQVKDLESNITNNNSSIIIQNQSIELSSNKIQLYLNSNEQISVTKFKTKQEFIVSDSTTQFTLVTELDKKPIAQRLKQATQPKIITSDSTTQFTLVTELDKKPDFLRHVEKPTRNLTHARRFKSAEPTAGASSRETLSAVAHGGNPQDRAASPTHCLPTALAPQPPSLKGKGENSKPLSLQERGLERGSPDPVKSKNKKPVAKTPKQPPKTN